MTTASTEQNPGPRVPFALGLQDAAVRRAADVLPDALVLLDGSATLLYANAAAIELFGTAVAEPDSANLADYLPGLSIRWPDTLASLAREKTLTLTARARHPARGRFELTAVMTALGDDAYAVRVTPAAASDPVADLALQAIERAEDAAVLFDSHGRIVFANQAARALFGQQTELENFATVGDLDPALAAAMQERRAPDEILRIESELRQPDGTYKPVQINVVDVRTDGKTHGCLYIHDNARQATFARELGELRFTLNQASDAIYLYDEAGDILYANGGASEALGYTVEQLQSMNLVDIDPSYATEHITRLWSSAGHPGRPSLISHHRRRDGSVYPVEIRTNEAQIHGRKFSAAFVRDITDRLQAEKALRESEERFRVIADTSPVALIISRVSDGKILYANKQCETVFHRARPELAETSIMDLLKDSTAPQEVLDRFAVGEPLSGTEISLPRPNKAVWLSLNTRTTELHGERVVCSALLDITEAHELSDQLAYHATYDPLTGLVNRREFESRLAETIARDDGSAHALCYLDLDQFKVVNDTCGHIAGDELLRQLGDRLRNTIRKDDILARLGGDEFAVLLENCTVTQAERVATAIRKAVQEFRFSWQDNSFALGVSIGLVPIGSEGESITNVLRRADAACYAAKEGGRNRTHTYRPDDEELAERQGEMQWVTRLNSALEQDRLRLWAQKIMPIQDPANALTHIEVLVRMETEEGKTISPGSFLAAAERYNLAARIDKWVSNATFSWLKTHPEQLKQLGLCFINLSGHSLSDDDLLQTLLDQLDDPALPASKICFEVTETAAIANLSHATNFMKALKERGCTFALDDFGSGLSSFAYLKHLPIDYLKIDGLFVTEILDDPIDLAMVTSINEIGHVMGKKTIAEFVESDRILAKLREVGLDYAQGYGIADPEPLSQALFARELKLRLPDR